MGPLVSMPRFATQIELMTVVPRFLVQFSPVVLAGIVIFSVLAFDPPGNAPTPTVFEEPAVVREYQARITAGGISPPLRHLASDEYAGRETGTEGQRAAARYLASAYRDMGLAPPPDVPGEGIDAFLQEFTVYGSELYHAALRIERPHSGDLAFSYDPQDPGNIMYLASGTLPTIAGPVEFHGLEDGPDHLDYEDYSILHSGHAEKDAVWVMSFAPDGLLQPAETVGPFRSNTTWPRLRLHIPQLDGPLPLGYILVASPDRVARESKQVAEVLLSIGRLSLEPESGPYGHPPVFVVSPAVAEAILADSGLDLERLRAREAESTASVRVPIPGVRISSHIDLPVRAYSTENVAAYIEGIDPEVKDEVVVISAHFDHVGVNPLLEGDTIFNGADDNASGNAALLEIAEAFMHAKREGHGPRRSIAFVHFTGEEKGLLGSRYYADVDPLFPLDLTVANINLDMIGRSDPTHGNSESDYVYLIGSRLVSEELHEILDRVNEVTGVNMELDERFNSSDDPNRFYRRSDQWNFGKYGVPSVFIFTGTHEDYHRPTDEADKVDYERVTRITRLIFGATWQLANQDGRPALNESDLN